MTHPTIRIAAAIVRDANGNLLLVRKRGTSAFMQPGGKIEIDELPVNALARELREELGVRIAADTPTHVGCFRAPAANEPDSTVEAELFELTPLTRDAVIPRYRRSSEKSTDRR